MSQNLPQEEGAQRLGAMLRSASRIAVFTGAGISTESGMPEDAMNRAEEASLAADLFLVLGSSLVVYPAAGFPALAASNGARLAIVNRDPTDQDGLAELVVHDEIGPTLERALRLA